MIKKFIPKIGALKLTQRKLIVLILVICFFVIVPVHVPVLAEYRYVEVIWSKEEGRDLNFTNERPKDWVELSKISKHLQTASLCAEDARFYQHPGFEVEAILKAAKLAWETKKFLKGGSTITQQLAKNLYFAPDKNIVRKLREFQAAIYLEWRWGKSRIFETYLNVIEFGPGLYGIRKAAKHYFKKEPQALNPREAAFIAMLLPNPKKYSSSYRRGELTRFARRRVEQILKNMYRSHYISDDQRAQGGNGFLAVATPTPIPIPTLPGTEAEASEYSSQEVPLEIPDENSLEELENSIDEQDFETTESQI